MACNECKKKKDQHHQNGETTFEEGDPDVIDLVPKSLVGPELDQNIVLKFVVFISIGVMLPFIILALFYQLFMTFFFPAFLSRFNTKVYQWVKNLFNKYAKYRATKEVEKRKKEFENNRGYEEDSELVDIEVYDEEGYNEELNDNNNK
jgi:hypothetical protein